MSFSDLFIRRPVLSTVLACMILLLGFQGIFNLSIRQYPKVDETAIFRRLRRVKRDRRSFGSAEEVPYDTSGRILLTGKLRRRGQLDDLALFVGVGATFELWNPQLALKSKDPEIREFAAEALEERGLAS